MARQTPKEGDAEVARAEAAGEDAGEISGANRTTAPEDRHPFATFMAKASIPPTSAIQLQPCRITCAASNSHQSPIIKEEATIDSPHHHQGPA